MTELYFALKWLHIATAAIAFGSNVTHFFWLVAANNDPVHRANILRLVKTIDDRMAVPCYAVTVMCGLAMWLWQWPGGAPWLVVSLCMTVLLSVMGICFGPCMRRWIRAAGNPPADLRELVTMQRRLTCWWAAIALSVPGILLLMVRKPALW